MPNPSSLRKIVWANLLFFIVTGAVALIGTPLYVSRFGVSALEIALMFFYMIATGMSITAGYHRLYAHATFQAHPLVQFFFLFFGAAAFEQSAFRWASQHRDHHRYVDTDQDPYSIKKGFFYAHIGWLIFWRHAKHYENVKDLQKNPMVMSQHQYYLLWAVGSGIVLPVLIGALGGHALGAFVLAVCTRLVIVHHVTFCINSVCHMFGKATYDIHASARDHWFVAFLTNGEGYHNFHHRFPTDYRNGVRWYQWDPSKWLISLLSRMGFAWSLKKVSNFRILEARLTAENQRIEDWLAQWGDSPRLESFCLRIQSRYQRLRQLLTGWETVSREYQALFYDRLKKRSHEFHELTRSALMKLEKAKRTFHLERGEWIRLIKSNASLAAAF